MIVLQGDPSWLRIASEDIGVREIHGAATAPKITQWLKRLRAWWADDETPWCGVACAAWMKAAGIEPPKEYFRAKSWLQWGRAIEKPVRGCVVVFGREGGGHVGLVVGETPGGGLAVLGGNQGDAVSVAAFSRSRVLGFRVPVADVQYTALPRVDVGASRSEA